MKGSFMTVKGVNSAAGIPVAASQNLNVQNSAQPAAAVSVDTMLPVQYEQPKQSSSNPAKVLMYLGLIGAATYAFVKYKNIQALKPIIQNSEKATKDGGRLTTQILKTKSRKPNGDIVISGEKSVKTYYDKDGIKRAEIIHDKTKHEIYKDLEKKERKMVKRLGGILKLADGLVRGDKHQIKNIKLEYDAVDNIVKFILYPLEGGLPDINCALRKRDLFELGFKCQSVIVFSHE